MSVQIQIAGQPVALVEPSRKWRRILRAPVGALNRELWACACIGVCWGGPNRPADGANPRDVMAYGEAVLDELIRRGATDDEIDDAGVDASMLVFGVEVHDDPSPAEVAETADFSGPPDDGSAT